MYVHDSHIPSMSVHERVHADGRQVGGAKGGACMHESHIPSMSVHERVHADGRQVGGAKRNTFRRLFEGCVFGSLLTVSPEISK